MNRETRPPNIGALRIVTLLLLLAVWQILGSTSETLSFALGTPTEAAREFWTLLTERNLLHHFVVTAGETVTGLIIGTSLGSAAGLSLWYFRTAARVAQPFVVAMANAPVLAFAPLLVVWFGVGFALKAALAAFFTFFASLYQVYRGADKVSESWVNLFELMGASRKLSFFRVIIPGASDAVLASLRFNVGLAVLGAFIGEFIAATSGLGYLVLRAARLFNVPGAVAGALAFLALALLLDGLGALVEGNRARLLQLVSVPSILRRS